MEENREKIEQEIRQLEKAWDAAVRARDLRELDRLMAPEFVLLGFLGEVVDKTQNIALITSKEINFEYRDSQPDQIRIYGSTALVIGRINWTDRDDLGSGGEARYLRVYVNHEGEWQIVAAQATLIQ